MSHSLLPKSLRTHLDSECMKSKEGTKPSEHQSNPQFCCIATKKWDSSSFSAWESKDVHQRSYLAPRCIISI